MITSFHFFQFERLRCILLSDFFFIDEISREEEWKKLERNETKWFFVVFISRRRGFLDIKIYRKFTENRDENFRICFTTLNCYIVTLNCYILRFMRIMVRSRIFIHVQVYKKKKDMHRNI